MLKNRDLTQKVPNPYCRRGPIQCVVPCTDVSFPSLNSSKPPDVIRNISTVVSYEPTILGMTLSEYLNEIRRVESETVSSISMSSVKEKDIIENIWDEYDENRDGNVELCSDENVDSFLTALSKFSKCLSHIYYLFVINTNIIMSLCVI